MDAKLIVVGGKANKSEIKLRLPTIIGRSRDADLTMAHPMVSRQHCELYEEGGLLRIRDLGSLNGTFVGRQQVREADLPPGAEFTVGPLTFRVQYAYAGVIAAAPPAPQAPAGIEPVEVEPLELAPLEVEPIAPQPAGEPPDFADAGLPAPGPPAAAEPPVAAEDHPVIAPADGELPDLAAWGATGGGQGGAEPVPPPAPLFEAPPGVAPEGPGEAESPPTREEKSTLEFEALDLAPAEEPVSVEPEQPPDQRAISPPSVAPGADDLSFADEETERVSQAEEDSARRQAPPAAPAPDKNKIPRPDDDLNEFLDGLK